MIVLSDENATAAMRGDWDWETGIGRDPIADAERIRDYGMLVAYSNWAHVKNSPKTKARFADCGLAWVASIAGRRESRRLMGDVVFSENDVDNETPFPDGTCLTSWSVDLHFPKDASTTRYAGEPYRAATVHKKVKSCPIPCDSRRRINSLPVNPAINPRHIPGYPRRLSTIETLIPFPPARKDVRPALFSPPSSKRSSHIR